MAEGEAGRGTGVQEAAGSTGLLDTRITEGTSTLVKALASEYSTDTNFHKVIKIEKKTHKKTWVFIYSKGKLSS